MSNSLADERIKRKPGRPPRDPHESRASIDRSERDVRDTRVDEKREIVARLREARTKEAMPSPPKIPGWHYYWHGTMANSVPVGKLLSVGYEYVRPNEIPDFIQMHGLKGSVDGKDIVSWAEMVLLKLPEDIYQALMFEEHHMDPLRSEERIRSLTKNIPVHSDADIGDGTAQIVQTPVGKVINGLLPNGQRQFE